MSTRTIVSRIFASRAPLTAAEPHDVVPVSGPVKWVRRFFSGVSDDGPHLDGLFQFCRQARRAGTRVHPSVALGVASDRLHLRLTAPAVAGTCLLSVPLQCVFATSSKSRAEGTTCLEECVRVLSLSMCNEDKSDWVGSYLRALRLADRGPDNAATAKLSDIDDSDSRFFVSLVQRDIENLKQTLPYYTVDEQRWVYSLVLAHSLVDPNGAELVYAPLLDLTRITRQGKENSRCVLDVDRSSIVLIASRDVQAGERLTRAAREVSPELRRIMYGGV